MKVRQAIELARGLKQIDQVNYPDLLMLQFLNECEGKLQTEFLHIADVDCQRYTEDDMDMDLIVGPPHDKLYYAYLCAMIDFTNGEYAKYNNSIIVANAFMAEWAAWFNRTHERDGRQYLGVFLSAYGIAVKHGYAGTEEEWLESLEGPAGPQGIQGEPGPQGAPGTVSFDELTEEQLAMLMGPEGPQGVPGIDGQDGIGIQSVEQTTTSTEDGGTNVVTVTKTDGATSTFYVRNGSRGSTGPAGSDGQDGADGKSAYQYAVEGGYTGTEEAFAAKMAAEIPDTLPNPNSLTFTGAVTGSYDGSAPLEVEIPSGGGGITITNTATVGQTIKVSAVDETGQPTEWEAVDMASGGGEREWALIEEITLEETVSKIEKTLDTPCDELLVVFSNLLSTPNSSTGVGISINGYSAGSTSDGMISGAFVHTSAPAHGIIQIVKAVDYWYGIVSGINSGSNSKGIGITIPSSGNGKTKIESFNFWLTIPSTNSICAGATLKIYTR